LIFQGAPAPGFGGYANAKRFGRRSVLALGVPNSGAVACSAQTGRLPAPAFPYRGAWGFPLSASARGKCSGAQPARNRYARWREIE